jgi:hypothetical protein
VGRRSAWSAARGIFLTDTVTGKTEIWRVSRNASLSGNRRAVQTVRSVSIPGVVFRDTLRETEKLRQETERSK